jgi:hypothetical protein
MVGPSLNSPAWKAAVEPTTTSASVHDGTCPPVDSGISRRQRPESGQAWQELAADYEQARAREDSVDRLVEWPSERDTLGDVTGLARTGANHHHVRHRLATSTPGVPPTTSPSSTGWHLQ